MQECPGAHGESAQGTCESVQWPLLPTANPLKAQGMPANDTSMPRPRMRETMSSTRRHCPWPTWEGPRQAAPMQKRVLPPSFARSAAWKGQPTDACQPGCAAAHIPFPVASQGLQQ